MLKYKSTVVLLLGLTFAFILCIQIGVYLINDFFAPIVTVNIFQFCISLFERNTLAYFIMLLSVNTFVIYTMIMICTKVFRQIVLSKQFKKKIVLLTNEKISEEMNHKFNRLNQDIFVINYHNPVAFTFGFRRPVIVLSKVLIEMLDCEELEAVVYHETAHQKNYDTLKIFLLQLISEVMWYLPITKWSFQNYQIMIELLADEYAIARTGSELGLGSALLKLIKTHIMGKSSPALVPFTEGTVDYRLKQLIEPKYSIPVKIQTKSIIISINVLILLMLLLVVA